MKLYTTFECFWFVYNGNAEAATDVLTGQNNAVGIVEQDCKQLENHFFNLEQQVLSYLSTFAIAK